MTHPLRARRWSPRGIRAAIGWTIFAAMSAIFLDYARLIPREWKEPLASIQFVPAALTLGTGLLSVLALAGILLLTLAFGRVYCSTICPLGLLQDLISGVAKAIARATGARRKPLPFRKTRTKTRAIFLTPACLSVAFGIGGTVLAWLDPYSIFGRFCTTLFRPPLIAAHNSAAEIAKGAGAAWASYPVHWPGVAAGGITLAFFLLIVFLAATRGRLWCNTVCPVGTLLGFLAKKAIWKISLDAGACAKCGECLSECPAQCIDLRAQKIDFGRCVGCLACISTCQENGIHYRRLPSPALTEKKEAAIPPASTGSSRRSFLAANAAGAIAIATGGTCLAGKNDGNTNRGEGHGKHGGRGRPLAAVAPPGAGSVERFLAACTGCQLCVASCPSQVLEPSLFDYGSLRGLLKPRLNFDRSFCNINCTTCGNVCPLDAIRPLTREEKRTTRIGLAEVHLGHCIVTREGTACGACAEHCPTAALQMKVWGGFTLGRPVVDADLCVGCGACQFACPALPRKAILVGGIPSQEKAKLLQEPKLEAPKSAEGDFPF